MPKTSSFSRLVALSLATALIAGCAPVGPLAGSRLRGVVMLVPISDWSFADGYEKIQVETRPEDPYSVTTWCAAWGDHLYVPSQDPEGKRWVRNVLEDPRVRVRIGGRVYLRRAVRVTDPVEYRAVAEQLIAKYDLERPDPADAPKVWIFRLHPR